MKRTIRTNVHVPYSLHDMRVIDETFGYNTTKLAGWLLQKGHLQECTLEIYHLGDMIYVTKEE